MGIPRLTQDLRPYLERCIVARQTTGGPERRIVKCVIDGPSMVYHVYKLLVSSTIGSTLSPSNQPSYALLNAAVQCFLSDLESCGAAIKHIFFDGGLPPAKRPTRLERLERSRAQLQFQRLTNPILRFPHAENSVETRAVVGEALWQTGSSRTIASTALTAPFIVSAVIEHLKNSRWASAVSVVPGEAEAFCAPAAKACNAAVLTNDSDLVLFKDLSGDGIVVLLHSISLSITGDERLLKAQCWRPREIAQKLELTSLLGLGFERSKGATASFGTILQRAKNSESTAESDAELIAFSSQFDGAPESSVKLLSSKSLTDFDPRLAEFVCQLLGLDFTADPVNVTSLQLTLPILYEDPARDSSWSYGRTLRHAAYCLLHLHKLKTVKAHLAAESSTSNPSVSELNRKGQRISDDKLPLASSHQPISSARADMNLLNQYLTTGSSSASNRPTLTAISYTLWALHSVIDQRLAAGKQSYSRILVEQFLGLAPLPLERQQKVRPGLPVSDEMNGWTLLHLNANVQAMLHSARMLKQTVDFLKKSPKQNQAEPDNEIAKLAHVLGSMPPIEDLFLDPNGVRYLMQRVPQDRLKEMIGPIFEQAGWSLNGTIETTKEGMSDLELVVSRKSKKRKKAKVDEENKASASAARPRSTNPFDLLL